MKKPKTATAAQKRFIEEKNQRDEKKSVYLLSAIMGTTALVMFIINILNEYYLISLLSFSYVIISIFSLVIFKKNTQLQGLDAFVSCLCIYYRNFSFLLGWNQRSRCFMGLCISNVGLSLQKNKSSLAIFVGIILSFIGSFLVRHSSNPQQ